MTEVEMLLIKIESYKKSIEALEKTVDDLKKTQYKLEVELKEKMQNG